MRKLLIPLVGGLLAAGALASAQPQPSPGIILNRISSAYRSAQTFRAAGTLTRSAGEKSYSGTVTVAMQRPNLYMLEVTGDKLGTLVVTDGTSLLAARPDRKIYTKSRAPLRLMMADILGQVDEPSPGARIITLLLQARMHDQNDPLARAISAAKIAPNGYQGKQAYVLTFDMDETATARVTVLSSDYLIRKVEVKRSGTPYTTETYDETEADKPLPDGLLTKRPPEGSLMVSALPPIEIVDVISGPAAADFTLRTVDGADFTLSSLRGKVVLLNFFFVT